MSGVAPASKFAIDWWKNRHDIGYFPTMDQHLDWKVYEEMEPLYLDMMQPTLDDDALEIGCGYGQRMAPMALLVKSISGFDLHPTLLEQSRKALAGCANATMVLGDGLTIPFRDASFSLVYCISVFQHMPRATVASYLAETRRVLKGDGRALLHWRHADGVGPYSEDIEVDHRGDWSVGWTADEIRAAVATAGLRVTRLELGQMAVAIAVPA